MEILSQPKVKPNSALFSTGPCKKNPAFSLSRLQTNILGRSHRSTLAKSILAESIAKCRELLELPSDYLLGIVPASDSGAFEMAMWNMLGLKPVDVFHWESFSKDWFEDISLQLKLPNVQNFSADYGDLPDLSLAKAENDIVFPFNGTTSGVCVPNMDWVAADRTGLTFCDATSAVFSMPIEWLKIDVGTFSWQKSLGGEGAHGMLVLSPRAIERIEQYQPPWPIPKIMRLKNDQGKFAEAIFRGVTINTPSLLCVADFIQALDWAQSIGGLQSCIGLCELNYLQIEQFVAQNQWISFLAKDSTIRSHSSVCLKIDASKEQIVEILKLLEDNAVAYDINSYKSAPAGIRVWCGPTIEAKDVQALMQWLQWSYLTVTKK